MFDVYKFKNKNYNHKLTPKANELIYTLHILCL